MQNLTNAPTVATAPVLKHKTLSCSFHDCRGPSYARWMRAAYLPGSTEQVNTTFLVCRYHDRRVMSSATVIRLGLYQDEQCFHHKVEEPLPRRDYPALPDPDCPMGYTHLQIEQIMGDQLEKFYQWMRGSTVGICEGEEYNYETKSKQPTPCYHTPHGTVTYRCDVEQFIRGGAPLD